MKMRSGIIQLIYVAMGYMVTGANVNGNNGIELNPVNSMKPDTSVFIKVDSFNLSILPPSSGIQYYKDGIVFLSSSKSEGKMLSDHLSFGTIDARYAVLNDSVLENHQIFSPSTAFPYPCDAITFTSDYNTMYFTKYSKTDGSEKIYQGKLSQGSGTQSEWTLETNPLSFCTDKSTYTHPALSTDGEMMVFASNSSGSIGGMDLFMTRKSGEAWSVPVNLGQSINTKSNELFPFLDSENNLFFSSDGNKGFGGYDIFVCKFKGNAWGNPINLSTPVNTEFDDVAFTINRKDGKSAFYTVRQKSGKQSSQLIMVTLNNNIAPKYLSNLSQLFTNPDLHETTVTEAITAAKEPEVKVKQEVIPEETRKVVKPLGTPVKQTSVPETKPVVTKPTQGKTNEPTVKQTAALPVSQVKPSESKVEPSKALNTATSGKKDVIIYRVQIFSGGKGGSTRLTINSKNYMTYEYSYNGGYRTCVGEFSTLTPAKDFQNICRKSGYPQAFVVAFKNNVRSTDPVLFK